MAPRIVTAAEAAQLIPDGATVAVCGCLSMLEPDTVLAGIEARFLGEGRPRGLTVVHPVMVGSRKGSGINRFAHDGLMRRVIGGSFSIEHGPVGGFRRGWMPSAPPPIPTS